MGRNEEVASYHPGQASIAGVAKCSGNDLIEHVSRNVGETEVTPLHSER